MSWYSTESIVEFTIKIALKSLLICGTLLKIDIVNGTLPPPPNLIDPTLFAWVLHCVCIYLPTVLRPSHSLKKTTTWKYLSHAYTLYILITPTVQVLLAVHINYTDCTSFTHCMYLFQRESPLTNNCNQPLVATAYIVMFSIQQTTAR